MKKVFLLSFSILLLSIQVIGQLNSSQMNISYDAPKAIVKISPPELVRWLDLKIGHKFKEPEDSKLKQAILTNPYLSPERPFFGDVFGLQSAPDGSLILAGTAGLDDDGGVKGIGWWKIAPDGAITSFLSRPYDKPYPGIYPSEYFSITADGSILTIFTEEINTNRVGTKIVRLRPNGVIEIVVEGLENPRMPVQDNKGNIWVANKKGTELIRISPDGMKSTNLIGDRNWSNNDLLPQDRIPLEHISWDPVNGELVVAGSFITSKPHELHSSIWRITQEGNARRVYYTMKSSQSSIGQRIDAIRALTVDDKGRIVISTRMMNDKARRQITRLNEKTGKLEVLTGQSFQKVHEIGFSDYRPGHEEASYDGIAAHANFRETKNICFGKDGTLFILDAHQVRRLDNDGIVRTWAY